MKKVFNSLFVVIAAMIAFTACVKEENAPADLTKTVQFFAESIETKSVFGTPDGTTYPTLWTENDEKVKVLLNLNEEAEGALSVSDDFKKATFNAEVKVDEDGSVAPYKFYVMSPAAAYLGKNAERFSATIPTVQKPLVGSVDEAAQILYAISEDFDQIPESVVLNFKHFTAYGKLTLNNLELGDAKILSVALTSEVDFAGRWNYMIADGSYTVNSGAKTITLETSNDKDIWFACAPVDVSGKNMKVTVNTDKGPINREFNFNSNCSFKAGKIASFSVDMEGCAIEESVVYELVTDAAELTPQSKIIIVAKDYDLAISTTQNNNNRAQAAVTKNSDNTISDPGSDVQVITVENGKQPGTIAFNVGNGYLYAASSTSNHLKTDSSLSDNSSWAVTIDQTGIATIKAQGTNTRNWLRYNDASNNGKLFSCYGSGQKDVVIYKQRGTGVVLKNYLIVSPASFDVDATATSVTFSVSSDLSWNATPSAGASVSKEGDNVTVSFAANTASTPKTYTVTVSASGAESQTVTITQAAAESITTYASLTDLVGDGAPTTTARKVTVTLKDEVITGIYTTSSGYRNGVFLQVGEQEIEIYSRDVPAEWVVGGTISGTLSECDWKLYYSTWELCPSNWAELTYTAPAGGTDEPDQPDQPDQPEGTATITVNFSDYTAGVQYAKNEEHIIDEVLTLYTTLCHFTSELRIYSSSTNNGYVVSNKLPGNITGMTFNAGNKVDKLDVYGSQNGTDWTLVGQVSVTSTSYKDYSLDFAGTQYQYFKLDVNGSNQIRLKSMSVTYKTN